MELDKRKITLISGFLGGVYGAIANAETMALSSASYWVKNNSANFETMISNVYGTAWTNNLNVYLNVSGAMH